MRVNRRESGARLAPGVKDLVFNYRLGHLGDQSDGITPCDPDYCQSYNGKQRNSSLTLGNPACVCVCV